MQHAYYEKRKKENNFVKKNNKYKWILETDTIKQIETKEKVRREYLKNSSKYI